MTPHVVVSSCGTSVLRWRAPSDVAERLRVVSDQSAERAIGDPDLRAWIDRRAAECASWADSDAARASAELHAITAIWRENGGPSHDERHILLGSDTALGMLACMVLARWISVRTGSAATPSDRVVWVRVPGLVPTDPARFRSAMDWLDRWAETVLVPMRAGGAGVTFSLNGGFKAAQAALQHLGGRCADEIVYVFDAPGAPLLRLPGAAAPHRADRGS